MEKWLVISDTHDNIPMLKKLPGIIESYGITHIFHAGDFIAPFVMPYLLFDGIEFIGVFGNNDGERLFMLEKSQGKVKIGPIEIETPYGKVFLMHEPYALNAAVKSRLYSFVFYGHTHKVDIRKDGEVLVVNPGEYCGYLTGLSTVAIVDPETKEVELIEVGHVDR
ncbi:YfcE family phosphodiesterase [bacterium 3DAC]|jgi:hypothetical protein|nr:YfcE family phosphodiesterase [bacterium 3DAC]